VPRYRVTYEVEADDSDDAMSCDLYARDDIRVRLLDDLEEHPVDDFGHPFHTEAGGKRVWYSTTEHGIICAICGEEFPNENTSRKS
jgi:hypothetical protein